MNDETKIWQTTIWLKESDPVTLYGETQAELRTAVAAWLKENQPAEFNNAPADYAVQRRIMRYFYSDGWLEMTIDLNGHREILAKGWYYRTPWMLYEPPHYLGSQSGMIAHFVEKGMLIEPGPDSKEDLEQAGYPIINKVAPFFAWAFAGIISGVCYLSMPISGGMQTNHIIAQGNPFLIVAFIIFIGAAATFLGPLGLQAYWKMTNDGRPTTND